MLQTLGAVGAALLLLVVAAAAIAQTLGPTGQGRREALADEFEAHLKESALRNREPPRPYVPTDIGLPAVATGTRFDSNYGKLKVVLLDDKREPSIRDGRSLWGLSEVLVYWPSNDDKPIIVPRGFVTDLASIPRPLWSWLPPDGPWAKAAVIHDFLYYTQGKGVWKCHDTTLQRTYTKEEADWILRDAQKDRNVGLVSRNLVWLGVHFGGQNGWNNSPGITAIARCPVPPKLPPG